MKGREDEIHFLTTDSWAILLTVYFRPGNRFPFKNIYGIYFVFLVTSDYIKNFYSFFNKIKYLNKKVPKEYKINSKLGSLRLFYFPKLQEPTHWLCHSGMMLKSPVACSTIPSWILLVPTWPSEGRVVQNKVFEVLCNFVFIFIFRTLSYI